MGVRYAEVIGDPIGHSLSPTIHRFWLDRLGLAGRYEAVRVSPADFPRYLAKRCADPFWRGCSVTAPLKQAAAALVSDPTGVCRRIGACNAIFRSPLGCGIGANTDVVGVAAALPPAAVTGKKVCLIGAGGAARAVLEYLRLHRPAEVALLVRDPARATAAADLPLQGEFRGFDEAEAALAGAGCVVNASPLGMSGMPPLPPAVVGAVEATAEDAYVLDLVYAPLETELLRRADACGRRPVDGLAVLVGQAAPAFELFFGVAPPRDGDAELRERLER